MFKINSGMSGGEVTGAGWGYLCVFVFGTKQQFFFPPAHFITNKNGFPLDYEQHLHPAPAVDAIMGNYHQVAV